MYRKTTKKWLLLFAAPAWAVGLACLLSGCIALPGQEPFGEKTYPAEQAQAVYEKISADMEQREFKDQSGYSIQILPFILSEDVSDFDYDVYKTEEYMVFAAEGSVKIISGTKAAFIAATMTTTTLLIGIWRGRIWGLKRTRQSDGASPGSCWNGMTQS